MGECKHKSIDPYGSYCEECGQIYGDIIESQQARIEELEAEVQAYRDIRSDSTGVAGYYPNGDSALWDEFDIPEQEGE